MKAKFCFTLLLLIAAEVLAGWEPIPPLPEPNGGFACGVVNNKIVVIGGTNWKDDTKRWLDGIGVFDLKSEKWETHGRLPHPLAYALTAEWNGDLIIAGGTTGTEARREVWRVDRALKLTRIGELEEDAVLAAGGIVGKDLFLLGGCSDPSRLAGFYGRGVCLDLARGRLSRLPVAPGSACSLAASAVVGNELLIFAGVKPDPVREIANLSAAWALDAGSGKWRSLRSFPIAVRGASAVKLDKDKVLVAGGFGGQAEAFTAAAFIYDAQDDTYAKTIDLPVGAIVGLVRTGDYVYALGGEDRARHRTDACFRVKVGELLKAAKAIR